MNLNKIMLIGNVGNDPEVKTFEKGYLVKMSVATSEKWKDKDGTERVVTEWHSVDCWNSAYARDYVKKGNQVFIEGKMTYHKYKDKAGNDRIQAIIKMQQIGLLTNKAKSDNSGDNSQEQAPEQPQNTTNESVNFVPDSAPREWPNVPTPPKDDLPF